MIAGVEPLEMTNDQVLQVLLFYDEHLTKIEKVEGLKRWTHDLNEADELILATKSEQLKHARWMVSEMIEKITSGEMGEGKAFRWLGFLQGVFWSQGVFRLEELKAHNRSPDKGACVQCDATGRGRDEQGRWLDEPCEECGGMGRGHVDPCAPER
jgi:hypothetical protein